MEISKSTSRGIRSCMAKLLAHCPCKGLHACVTAMHA